MDNNKSDNKVDSNLKCCLIFALSALILNFVAFVTPFWIVSYSDYNSKFLKMGLWEACFNGYIHPEDYVSKSYYGCWYIFWPEYDYIRDWLNPPWFYGVQIMSSLGLICNGVGFIIIMLKMVDALELIDKTTNILALICQAIAGCCHVIVIVAMGAMSKDREWLPRPDHNHVSWSFAFEVLAGFCTFFCLFHLCMHWLVYNWAPERSAADDTDDYKHVPMLEKGGSGIYKSNLGGSSAINPQGGTSTIYSQGAKPASQFGTTSGATASAKVREAMTQKANQNAGSMGSLNNPYMRGKAGGSTHSLASLGRNGVQGGVNTSMNPNQNNADFRGSMSSLHSTSRRPRTPAQDSIV